MAIFDKNKVDKSKTLGQILRERREFKKLLLREVAAAINADTAMISKFEKGERKPTREQLSLLSNVLEVNEEHMLLAFLSDKIVSNLINEEQAIEVLRVAKIKIDAIIKK